MLKSVKKKWVEALRSGKFRQATGRLCKRQEDGHYGYCCLGVLRKIEPKVKGDVQGETLSKKSVSWLRLGKIAGDDVQNTLINMNDIRHATFEEIADWIEVNL